MKSREVSVVSCEEFIEVPMYDFKLLSKILGTIKSKLCAHFHLWNNENFYIKILDKLVTIIHEYKFSDEHFVHACCWLLERMVSSVLFTREISNNFCVDKNISILTMIGLENTCYQYIFSVFTIILKHNENVFTLFCTQGMLQ
jgi:hypothetical protein